MERDYEGAGQGSIVGPAVPADEPLGAAQPTASKIARIGRPSQRYISAGYRTHVDRATNSLQRAPRRPIKAYKIATLYPLPLFGFNFVADTNRQIQRTTCA